MNLEPGIRRSSPRPLTTTTHNPHSQRELAVHAAPTRTTSLPLHKLDAARTSRGACVRSPRRGAERVTWESMSARTPTPGGSSSRAPAVGEGRSGGGRITGGAWAQGGVRGRFPVRTGSCLHKQSAWGGVLEGVYPPGASTTAGSNYAHTRQRVASTFRDKVASERSIT